MVSLLSVSVTVGTILGAFLYSRLAEKRKTNLLVTICGAGLGAYYIFLTVIERYITVLWGQRLAMAVSSVCIGAGLGLMIAYVQVQFVKDVASEFIGRVLAIRYSISYACAPVISFMLGYLCKVIKINIIFLYSGIVIIVLFLTAGLWTKETKWGTK